MSAPLDLDAIRARNGRYEAAVLRESALWFAPAAKSAEDVPALIAEVERLHGVVAWYEAMHAQLTGGGQ